MLCPKCGAEVAEGSKFCTNCGAPLQASAPSDMPAFPQATPAGNSAPSPVHGAAAGAAGAAVQAPFEQHVQAGQPQQPRGASSPESSPAASYPPPPQPGFAATTPPPKNSGDGKAIGSLVCGILAIVFSPTILPSIVFGVVALVLASLAVKETTDVKAKAGRVCGIIGIALSVLMLIAAIVLGIAFVNYAATDGSSSRSSRISSVSRSSTSSSKSSTSSSSKSSSRSSSSSSSSPKSSSASKGGATTYNNARYGFRVSIPESFTLVREADNGDGAEWTNGDGIEVRAFGYNNVQNLDKDQVMETIWNGSKDAVLSEDEHFFEMLQPDGGEYEYYQVYVGDGSICQLEIVIPGPAYANSKATVNAIAFSFAPGDTSSGH